MPTDGRTDAWPQLQRLANGLAPGSTLYLRPGIYLVSHPLRMPSNTSLRGACQDLATLLLDRRSWGNFSNSFMVTAGPTGQPISSGVAVSDLTVNGNRTNVNAAANGGTPDGPANAGGGVKAGNQWTVTGVRLTNLNYFKMWVSKVSGVAVRQCRFDAGGGSASPNDNVGGGQSDQVELSGNTFAASATGNAIDLVRATNVTITGNVVNGAAGSTHSIYLEGVTSARVSGNTLSQAGLVMQSEMGYGFGVPVHNPRGMVVQGNVISDSPTQGISIRYDSPSYGQIPGGANTISGNTVNRAGKVGIAIIGCGAGAYTDGDTVSDNDIDDSFASGALSWNTGCGSFDRVGIGISAGVDVTVTNNDISDTHASAAQRWGISLSARNGRVPLSLAALDGNIATGLPNGLIVIPNRQLVTTPA